MFLRWTKERDHNSVLLFCGSSQNLTVYEDAGTPFEVAVVDRCLNWNLAPWPLVQSTDRMVDCKDTVRGLDPEAHDPREDLEGRDRLEPGVLG